MFKKIIVWPEAMLGICILAFGVLGPVACDDGDEGIRFTAEGDSDIDGDSDADTDTDADTDADSDADGDTYPAAEGKCNNIAWGENNPGATQKGLTVDNWNMNLFRPVDSELVEEEVNTSLEEEFICKGYQSMLIIVGSDT
jgi:hypothetical protein